MSWLILGTVGVILGLVAIPVLLIVPGWIMWTWLVVWVAFFWRRSRRSGA